MIFCVEDDASIRDIELYALGSAGFEAKGFADGESFLKALGTELPQLVILDVMLPGVDGVELLRHIRAERRTAKIPVIMATARGEEYDKVQSLDLGADYYLTKPFGIMEFLACVRAVLRRCDEKKAPQDAVLRSGEIELRPREHLVSVGGRDVTLTYKEFELLRLFLENPAIVFSRETLMNKIWGVDFCGETRTVDMHIRTLRQKLGDAGSRIETVRNVGYRLSVPQNDE